MSYGPSVGVPRIIHQTWRDADIPPGMGYPESWRNHNPEWTYRFWSDADLLAFFQTERSDLLDLFLSYKRPVQRADLARYCILQRYGGLYADIDTLCLGPIDVLAGDPRVILCEEPPRHSQPALDRGMEKLWFNGTMASPPGHPFWDDVTALCRKMADRRDHDVLETTGPLILSAAVERCADKTQLSLNSCALFAETDVHGSQSKSESYGSYGHLRLSNHLWRGSWYERRPEGGTRRKVGQLRQWRDRLFGGPRLKPDEALAGLDATLLKRPLARNDQAAEVLVLVPLRDAARDLPRCLELLRGLDHRRLHLAFGHGDSQDDTGAVLTDLMARHGGDFASVSVYDLPRNGPHLRHATRWKPSVQRARRAGIAMARNDLLRAALGPQIDWVLWIDVDVVDYPADILKQLLAVKEKIVTPHCVLDRGGPSFDLNSFVSVGQPTRASYYAYVRDGLLQPPPGWWSRRHLHDLRYLDRVPLNGVGGTMLLVQADLHRAGLVFPELPYRHLIETEGFGQMARDAGIVPVGLPNIEILHAKR